MFVLDKERTSKEIEEINRIKNIVDNKSIPEEYPDSLINKFRDRDYFIKQMGFSLISLDWIKPLSEWLKNKRCLEVMAGSGALSYALKEQNIDIISTDDFSWKPQDWKSNNRMWTDVEDLDAIEAVKKYGQNIDVIIMSWAYMDNTGTQVLKTMREVNPDCVMIYIGEWCGGCTADDEFFNILEEINDKSFYESVSEYKQWWGIHDRPYLVK